MEWTKYSVKHSIYFRHSGHIYCSNRPSSRHHLFLEILRHRSCRCEYMERHPSSSFSFSTISKPVHPYSCTITKAIDNSQITLNWLDNSSTEDGYQIWKVTDGGAPAHVTPDLNPNIFQYIDTAVISNHSYGYLIRSFAYDGSNTLYSDWCATASTNMSTGSFMFHRTQNARRKNQLTLTRASPCHTINICPQDKRFILVLPWSKYQSPSLWLLFLALPLFTTINPIAQIFKGYDTRRKADLAMLKTAFESYYADYDCYPPATILNNCGGADLQPYLSQIPCDPNDKTPYKIFTLPEGSACPQKYAIYAPILSFFDKLADSIPSCPQTFAVLLFRYSKCRNRRRL